MSECLSCGFKATPGNPIVECRGTAHFDPFAEGNIEGCQVDIALKLCTRCVSACEGHGQPVYHRVQVRNVRRNSAKL
jgi:hypothetical protein